MAKIIGNQKFRAKNGKEYRRVYFSWIDDSVDGVACDSTVVGLEYYEKLVKSDNLRVGYDKEKGSRFLYSSDK